jgi:alkyl sulfatase BDS1-like metallo-beta-lactamase superfamily hydrolase
VLFRSKSLLNAVDDGPVHSIIITHGHGDHTGGVGLWREPQTKVIAQTNMVEFLHYQQRLKGLFIQRNSAQFGFDLTSPTDASANESSGVNMLPNTLFDQQLDFTLGKEKFQLLHTPAETYDALTVWMPEYKAAFVGDIYYRSFPNIYTLRGTKPRWALDYIASIDRVLALKPEILLPSHGEPILGNKNISAAMTRYRNAIQYVHDETVRGMNAGKDVYSLMRDIKLPEMLNVGEAYGWVSWSVRGIYEGYTGWFDGAKKPSTHCALRLSSAKQTTSRLGWFLLLLLASEKSTARRWRFISLLAEQPELLSWVLLRLRSSEESILLL